VTWEWEGFSSPTEQRTIDTPEMGVFEKGTQGAFRFEV